MVIKISITSVIGQGPENHGRGASSPEAGGRKFRFGGFGCELVGEDCDIPQRASNRVGDIRRHHPRRFSESAG